MNKGRFIVLDGFKLFDFFSVFRETVSLIGGKRDYCEYYKYFLYAILGFK